MISPCGPSLLHLPVCLDEPTVTQRVHLALRLPEEGKGAPSHAGFSYVVNFISKTLVSKPQTTFAVTQTLRSSA